MVAAKAVQHSPGAMQTTTHGKHLIASVATLTGKEFGPRIVLRCLSETHRTQTMCATGTQRQGVSARILRGRKLAVAPRARGLQGALGTQRLEIVEMMRVKISRLEGGLEQTDWGGRAGRE